MKRVWQWTHQNPYLSVNLNHLINKSTPNKLNFTSPVADTGTHNCSFLVLCLLWGINGPIIRVRQITTEIPFGFSEDFSVGSIHKGKPTFHKPVDGSHLADFKCLNSPVGFALPHTHAHAEICGHLTLGGSRLWAWLLRNVFHLTPLCFVEEQFTNVSSYLLIFSFLLMVSWHTHVEKRQLVNNLSQKPVIFCFILFFCCLTSHLSISGTYLLRQLYVLPHWGRSCKSNFLSHPITVHCHYPASPSTDPTESDTW